MLAPMEIAKNLEVEDAWTRAFARLGACVALNTMKKQSGRRDPVDYRDGHAVASASDEPFAALSRLRRPGENLCRGEHRPVRGSVSQNLQTVSTGADEMATTIQKHLESCPRSGQRCQQGSGDRAGREHHRG